MKTLYITDLDGTILTKEQTVTEYSKRVFNALYERGTLVTYATARSLETATVVTQGVKFGAPRVVYNGAFVFGTDNKPFISHTFEGAAHGVIDTLLSGGLPPIVYSLTNGAEKFSFVPKLLSKGGRMFIDTRLNSVRINPVDSTDALYKGDIFYLLCIDDKAKLLPYYDMYKDEFHCVLSVEPYTHNDWLEIMPRAATKANAIRELKAKLNCRLVAFGDGKNDIDMFLAADECYAVENAVPELKEIATAVIGKNTDDAVAKWLEKNAPLK